MAALDPVSLKVVTTLEPAFIFTAEEAELLFKSAMVECWEPLWAKGPVSGR